MEVEVVLHHVEAIGRRAPGGSNCSCRPWPRSAGRQLQPCICLTIVEVEVIIKIVPISTVAVEAISFWAPGHAVSTTVSWCRAAGCQLHPGVRRTTVEVEVVENKAIAVSAASEDVNPVSCWTPGHAVHVSLFGRRSAGHQLQPGTGHTIIEVEVIRACYRIPAASAPAAKDV